MIKCTREVGGTSETIGQPSFVKDAEQNVEDAFIRLFNLVQQHYGEWLATHTINKLARLAVHPRNQTLGTSRQRVFTHIKTNEAFRDLCFTKEEPRECSRQFCFADTGRTRKEQHAEWSTWIIQTRLKSQHGTGRCSTRFGLPYHFNLEEDSYVLFVERNFITQENLRQSRQLHKLADNLSPSQSLSTGLS